VSAAITANATLLQGQRSVCGAVRPGPGSLPLLGANPTELPFLDRRVGS